MSDVSDLWQTDVDIRELTDSDLEAARNKYTRISDAGRNLHNLLATVIDEYSLDNRSEAADCALRIELAAAIDDYDVLFSHDDYDIAYTIPPVGWVGDQEFETVSLVDADDVDSDERAVGFSTAPVVFEMAQDAIQQGSYDNLSDIVACGLRRMLGQ